MRFFYQPTGKGEHNFPHVFYIDDDRAVPAGWVEYQGPFLGDTQEDDEARLDHIHSLWNRPWVEMKLLKWIDLAAERARRRYLSIGAGQALTYLEKEKDARAYAAAGYPSAQLAKFPWVDTDRQATGKSGRQTADEIIAAADAWKNVGTLIENKRRAGKEAVKAAADYPAMLAAKDAALTALDAL